MIAIIAETARAHREIVTLDRIAGKGIKPVAGTTHRYLITDAAYEAMKANGWTFKQKITASWN